MFSVATRAGRVLPMRRWNVRAAALCLMTTTSGWALRSAVHATPEGASTVRNASGLQLLVSPESIQPALRVVLPGHSTSDRSIEVLFPEHVTALKQGGTTAEHLYRFRPGTERERPVWRQDGPSLEYRRELPGDIRFLARATLEDDGVLFHYEFDNASRVGYDMIVAVTDPRLTGVFHDVRLERTYVHHPEGFELLAADMPDRLTMPLDRWLPARVLAAFTWPVPPQRVEKRDDGITYYHASRQVDVPFIATLSTDSSYVIASFAREPGNVWSNPELTCQHVDPQTSLAPGQRAALQVKMLVIRGSLGDALERAKRERGALK